ncbi:MFS transporter [Myceligenerans pegani]|uniref:MFS transporter n=1 Tax=Myceligenerans pegani TaxID=2776917 RepID=A0ABR9N3Q3_9MICO|nr:MFS transporter [Myceligenerans sp. TRM 65318]MBE1877975.1 MFS transporter [Myceligenerans sp. TRM 65318]MBE3020246.1 MFS transporter [Myceligenerans sp. TRM 65318]
MTDLAPAAAAVPPHGRRNTAVLVVSNLLGGIGVASGAAVGALLAEQLGGTSMGGLAQAASVLGAAVAAVPLAGTAARRGRRFALTWGYGLATIGGVLIVVAAVLHLALLFLAAMALYGVANAANLQSRYAAADNASTATRARTMAIVVWATTVGSVAGPNLAAPGAVLGRASGVPELSGPYLFAIAGYVLAGLVVGMLYRDPGPPPGTTGPTAADSSATATTADRPAADKTTAGANPTSAPAAGARASAATTTTGTPPPVASTAPDKTAPGGPPATALRALAWAWGHGRPRFAVVTMAVAHAVMIMVMVMTPLHMQHGGMSLELVGIVISLHVLGMFALSPVFGWLADRWGAVRTAVVGLVVQAVSVVMGFVAAVMADGAAADHSTAAGHAAAGPDPAASVVTAFALVLLGLGWSASVIATSAMLASVGEARVRVPLQGACDALMNYAGAGAAALAGPVLALGGFQAVNIAGAILLLPAVVALIARSRVRSNAPAVR